jgi:hypothetical protein
MPLVWRIAPVAQQAALRTIIFPIFLFVSTLPGMSFTDWDGLWTGRWDGTGQRSTLEISDGAVTHYNHPDDACVVTSAYLQPQDRTLVLVIQPYDTNVRIFFAADGRVEGRYENDMGTVDGSPCREQAEEVRSQVGVCWTRSSFWQRLSGVWWDVDDQHEPSPRSHGDVRPCYRGTVCETAVGRLATAGAADQISTSTPNVVLDASRYHCPSPAAVPQRESHRCQLLAGEAEGKFSGYPRLRAGDRERRLGSSPHSG